MRSKHIKIKFRFIVVLVVLCVLFISYKYVLKKNNKTDQPILAATSGKITKGMSLGTSHKINIKEGRVTVGNSTQVMTGPIEPHMTLSRWDNDASLNISYPVGPETQVETENNKITWKEKDKEVFFKYISKEEQEVQNPTPLPYIASAFSDKFEFDILLKKNQTQISLPTPLIPKTWIFFTNRH